MVSYLGSSLVWPHEVESHGSILGTEVVDAKSIR